MDMKPTLAISLLALAATTVSAQTLKNAPAPGLWETSWAMQVNGQDLQALMRRAMADAMAAMPAADRAAAEPMMKAQLAAFGGKRQECVTPAESARAADARQVLAELQQDAPGCRFEPVEVRGNTLVFKGRCNEPEGFTGNVDGEFTLAEPKAWTGRFGGQGRMANAEEMPGLKVGADGRVDYRMAGSGRWLAASCGAVKPR
jgi:hypothetical protein